MLGSRSLLALPFAVVLLVAGCSAGGDDDAGGTTTSVEVGSTTTVGEDPTTTTDGGRETTTTDAATTTTEATTTTAAGGGGRAGDDAELCGPLQAISDYDIDANRVVATGDWASVQRFFIDTAPGVLAAYDDAIALGTDLSDDLEVLKGVTEHTEAYAGESASLDEFATKLAGQPGLTAAGQSALAVNAFAEATCGFSTGGN